MSISIIMCLSLDFLQDEFTSNISLYLQICAISLTAQYSGTVYFDITVSEPTQHDSVNQVHAFNTITTSCVT